MELMIEIERGIPYVDAFLKCSKEYITCEKCPCFETINNKKVKVCEILLARNEQIVKMMSENLGVS